LIAGDICPAYNHTIDFQKKWLENNFTQWVESQPAKHTAITAGNHDFVFQHTDVKLPCHVLIDQSVEVEGLILHGCPWTLEFNDWAFNASEEFLRLKHGHLPDCDILLAHSPVYDCGDLTLIGRERIGSRALRHRLAVGGIKCAITGHNHSNPGVYSVGDTVIHHVPFLNDNYCPTFSPIAFDFTV
jgi:Icc-related predicted phosphoesterase